MSKLRSSSSVLAISLKGVNDSSTLIWDRSDGGEVSPEEGEWRADDDMV